MIINRIYKITVISSSVWLIILFMVVLFIITPCFSSDCPSGMVSVNNEFCIDQYEASLDEYSHAVSIESVLPEVNISQIDAAAACIAAGKRLCTDEEWIRACKGPNNFIYPYGEELIDGYCNDDEEIAISGFYNDCVSSEGAYDMVGNVHEWTSNPSGTFRGGYYYDISINGEGCNYATTAHNIDYSGINVGFRCCSDAISTSPEFSCVGFEPPMDIPVGVKRKNRVLPLKMELFDVNGMAITDSDIINAPIVEVDFSGQGSATIPSDTYLPAGLGDDGNTFVYSDGNWQFNLKTKNFSGPGTYTIRVISGNPSEYQIGAQCEAIFIIND